MTSSTLDTGVRILTSHSSVTVLDAMAPRYERATGRRYTVQADSAKTMLERIQGGETADIVILGTAVINGLAQTGIARPGSRPFARAKVGVAVRAGAPKPDIGTVEALKRALLDAKSIAHTVHGASGMYVPVLLERLGIAEQVRHKIVTRPGGYIGRVVAAGEAEVAVQQIVELLAVPGVDLVGPLPDPVQKVFETSAAVFTASTQPEEAESLLRFLTAPEAAGVFAEKGLESAAASR